MNEICQPGASVELGLMIVTGKIKNDLDTNLLTLTEEYNLPLLQNCSLAMISVKSVKLSNELL